jgi:phage N-6-adenine-methyltransferase
MIITKNMTDAAPHDQKDLWGTPEPLYQKINYFFDFTLDPCCTKQTAKCKKFYTPKENGLIQDWRGEHVFVNPPYSRYNIDKWVEKCWKESHNNLNVVALLPVSTSADWFQNYCLKQTKYFVNKRVRFVGAPFTAPFSSVFIHFNHIDKSLSFKQ